MSKNYDNWERLVAAVLKRELFRQLCRQDSISTVCSDSDSDSISANGGIVFIEGCNLEDLSRASAEALGEGSFGTTYKAVLEDGTTVAVKRLKEVVRKKDFEQQMEVVGNSRHENVAPLWAYYYSKDDKLMLYDFYNQGSVSQLLHGNGRSRLNWESRVKIAVGAAHGIAHVHAQSVFHGNIKSSNIFINRQGYGCVSEFGLAGLMNKKSVGDQKADVYSFGLLLLDLITGQSPVEEWLVDRLRFFEPSQEDLYCFHLWTILVDELDMIEYDRKRFPFVDVCWKESIKDQNQKESK